MAEEMNLNEKLRKIQFELKAPKSNRNDFGKYRYRSCEDILEAVKPLLNKYECTLSIRDDIVLIGDRYYIKSIAILESGNESITGTAFAREDESKKGMDASQVTGATSSYARKYALNGLFLIDDSKLEPVADPDSNASQEMKARAQKPSESKPAEEYDPDAPCSAMDIKVLESICSKRKRDPNKVFNGWPNLTKAQYAIAVRKLGGNEDVGENKQS